jgi:hypothetical protein
MHNKSRQGRAFSPPLRSTFCKKTSWQMSAANGSEPYKEIQIGLVRNWNDLSGTIHLKDFE